MAEYREERVVTESSDPVVGGPAPRRGNPTPIIVGICIALLIGFLIYFGVSQSDNDGGGDGDDGVRITVPNDLDQNDDNDNDGGGSGSGSGSDDGGSGSSGSNDTPTTAKP